MNSKERNEWLNWVAITSVPLRRLDKDNLPIGVASGCLLDYGGKRFLLSVQHAVERTTQEWVVELRYDKVNGTETYRPHWFNYVAEMRRGIPKIRYIDFCYTEVPSDFVSVYQQVTPGDEILSERVRHVFTSELDMKPSAGEMYAFAGQVFAERVANIELHFELHVYPDLAYVGQDNEYYVFRLPREHPGHDHFEGCSGAPIVDRHKNVVALVCCGDERDDTIRGVAIDRYKIAFDYLSGRLILP